MIMAAYDIGDLVRLSASFTDSDLVSRDPTAVTVRVKTPSGVATAYVYGIDASVVKDSTGHYHIDVSVTETGIYRWRWEGTGAIQAAEEASITVRSSEFS
jgi:hypothetical protein